MKFKKGDQVQILSGKDRGKTGTINKVFPKEGSIVVDGINVHKKRIRPKSQKQKGETVLVARPIAASNAMLVCKNCKAPTRIGRRTEGEERVRYCKKCNVAL